MRFRSKGGRKHFWGKCKERVFARCHCRHHFTSIESYELHKHNGVFALPLSLRLRSNASRKIAFWRDVQIDRQRWNPIKRAYDKVLGDLIFAWSVTELLQQYDYPRDLQDTCNTQVLAIIFLSYALICNMSNSECEGCSRDCRRNER